MNIALLLTALDGQRVLVTRPFVARCVLTATARGNRIVATADRPFPETVTELRFEVHDAACIWVLETVEQISYAVFGQDVVALEPQRLRRVAEDERLRAQATR